MRFDQALRHVGEQFRQLICAGRVQPRKLGSLACERQVPHLEQQPGVVALGHRTNHAFKGVRRGRERFNRPLGRSQAAREVAQVQAGQRDVAECRCARQRRGSCRLRHLDRPFVGWDRSAVMACVLVRKAKVRQDLDLLDRVARGACRG